MASFLHVTDLHFGTPENSVGVGKSWKAFRATGALAPARSLSTMLATHDRDVAQALTDLIVELEGDLDAVLLTGDIATTSAAPALAKARDWLKNTSALARHKPMIALPGNHDRFHPFPTYAPGAVAFDTAFVGIPTVRVAAPIRGVGTIHLDPQCLLVCVDLTLSTSGEAAHPLAQGIVRSAKAVADAIAAELTPQTTHVVVATHFPLDPISGFASHECINGPALRHELLLLADKLPVLLVSGHLHRESHYRQGNLFTLVGATASQTLHPKYERRDRPRNLAVPGSHAAVAVRTEPDGFVVTRWRYGEDANLRPVAKRFCEPTEIIF